MLSQRAPAVNIYKKPLGKLEVPHPNKDIMSKIPWSFDKISGKCCKWFWHVTFKSTATHQSLMCVYFPFFWWHNWRCIFIFHTVLVHLTANFCVCHSQSSTWEVRCRISHDFTGPVISWAGPVFVRVQLFGATQLSPGFGVGGSLRTEIHFPCRTARWIWKKSCCFLRLREPMGTLRARWPLKILVGPWERIGSPFFYGFQKAHFQGAVGCWF